MWEIATQGISRRRDHCYQKAGMYVRSEFYIADIAGEVATCRKCVYNILTFSGYSVVSRDMSVSLYSQIEWYHTKVNTATTQKLIFINWLLLHKNKYYKKTIS